MGALVYLEAQVLYTGNPGFKSKLCRFLAMTQFTLWSTSSHTAEATAPLTHLLKVYVVTLYITLYTTLSNTLFYSFYSTTYEVGRTNIISILQGKKI